MRALTKIILHYTESDNPLHDDIKIIDDWHRKRGFRMVGYHFLINRTGSIEFGRPINQMGAHAKGYNKSSVGIALSGKTHFTEAQFIATRKLCRMLLQFNPSLTIHGHCEFSDKVCPNFDYKKEIIQKLI